MRREDFDAIGGYDEVFQGWRVEDTDLNQRLEALGIRKEAYDGSLVACILHTDELRTRDHVIKDRFLSGAVNEFYRELKRYLERMDVCLDLEGRRRLYDDVRKAFAAGKASSTAWVSSPFSIHRPVAPRE